MPRPISPENYMRAVDALKKYGSAGAAAEALEMPRSTFRDWIKAAKLYGVEMPVRHEWTYPEHIHLDLKSCTVLVGGDSHFWPGQTSLVYDAFVDVAKYIKPQAIIMNGDLIDGTRVSRHGRLRNQAAPRVKDELDEAKRQLGRLPIVKHRIITLGNHDQRLDHYLANMAPEADDCAAGLADWFHGWDLGYAVMINQAPGIIPCEVRHYYRMGIHARWNNAVYSGIHIVTNHTHGLGVTPFNNRMGRIYGVEPGMLNWNDAVQFEYHQGMQSRAHAGFAVLTFDEKGNLLPPEIAEFVHGKLMFRGMSWGFGKPRTRVAA
ncbi:MAG: metallophosphoesterase [Acidobacteriaceae bacterium]|nr:metallophosphoesterase [Acidobacteriaceae bacterium]